MITGVKCLKTLIIYLTFLSSTLASANSDYLVGDKAYSVFNSIVNNGGDVYCTSNTCNLEANCSFDRYQPSGEKYKCTINQEVTISSESSKEIFDSIFNNALSVDGNCSASYCTLLAKCSYDRINRAQDERFICELF
ncbi:hypothetical protein M899_1014 [Bacteriovorax sp. BSW11_IV]|uniref:hypothetical protein n=1 Tax=Bacteriovorax sp. BSW11_IV TaxID=1353529 RepID=UPI000389E736|nr:hypothetical protein [Bacteriovorax sp. BSW11_IV]EQC48663.1 hypothetical protein M899_1014 [Bacteriovorax sp. BSW11_IV]